MKSQFEINKILSQWVTKQLSNRFESHFPLPSIEMKSSCIISSKIMFGVFKNDDNDDVRLVGKWVWVAN